MAAALVCAGAALVITTGFVGGALKYCVGASLVCAGLVLGLGRSER